MCSLWCRHLVFLTVPALVSLHLPGKKRKGGSSGSQDSESSWEGKQHTCWYREFALEFSFLFLIYGIRSTFAWLKFPFTSVIIKLHIILPHLKLDSTSSKWAFGVCHMDHIHKSWISGIVLDFKYSVWELGEAPYIIGIWCPSYISWKDENKSFRSNSVSCLELRKFANHLLTKRKTIPVLKNLANYSVPVMSWLLEKNLQALIY